MTKGCYDSKMREPTVRMALDIPVTLYGRLREAAAREGFSARQLILSSIERAVAELEPQRVERRLNLRHPLVASNGRKPFDLTNEQIYELIELP